MSGTSCRGIGIDGLMAEPAYCGDRYVLELRSGSPSDCNHWFTVMLSWVNSPV